MKTLIIGMGEVGTALYEVLKDYKPEWIEKGTKSFDNERYHQIHPFEIIHICFPYSDNFVKNVKNYQKQYKPKYTVIHSTVPVGVSRRCNAIHSPIRGLHPHLTSGIRTFVKYLGGRQASEVADYFRRAGLRVCLYEEPETTEALKLFDTLYYGVCVEFAKEVKRFCNKHNLNYSDVYRLANITYNEGYIKLDHPEFVRPVLEPIMKKIGGHCVRENARLLDTPFASFIEGLNKKYG